MTFSAQAFAKCIIAGEHSVLRGSPAIVFPVKQKNIVLSYCYDANPLRVEFFGEFESPMLLVFWGLIDEALQKLNRPRSEITGFIEVQNNIPLGSGLGFSAAFCVVITKLFIHLGWVSEDNLCVFATSLEDYFHGKSSGLDVVGSISPSGTFFLNKENYHNLDIRNMPRIYLMHTGIISTTAKCVQKVNGLHKTHESRALLIDKKMESCVFTIKDYLERESCSFSNLVDAIKTAQDCFCSWGLLPDEAKSRIDFMYDSGAEAVKLTGAGGGGYLLGVWRDNPHPKIIDQLIII